MSFEAFRKLGFPGADDLGNMFQFKHDFEREFCAARPVDQARALYPGLQTFRQWLARHAKADPPELTVAAGVSARRPRPDSTS